MSESNEEIFENLPVSQYRQQYVVFLRMAFYQIHELLTIFDFLDRSTTYHYNVLLLSHWNPQK